MKEFITVIAALVAAPVLGGLLAGIDRKLPARLQGRVGPPVLQPFYDVVKLLHKEPLAVNRVQVSYVFLHLAFMLIVIVLLVTGRDLLMVLFAHAFSTIALILAGMSVRSPYSRIGSQRKIMQMLAYEPILVLLVVGVYLSTGNFLAATVVTTPRPLLLTMPLVFLAFLMAVAIKLEKSPFDVASSHHAHQALVKGITIEIAGPYLALVEITRFCEQAALFAVIAMFWAQNLFVGALLAIAAFVALILVDNCFARLTTLWMVRYMWTVPMLMALSNIIWLYA